jgi:transposase
MPGAIPESKRQRIQVKLELGGKPKQVADETNVATRTVQEYARNLKRYGTVRPPKIPHQGRPRTITPEMEDVLLLKHVSCSR